MKFEKTLRTKAGWLVFSYWAYRIFLIRNCIMGVLNALWQPKGYVTAEQRRFATLRSH